MERKSHHELGYGSLRISSGPKCQGIPTLAGAIGPHFKNRPFTFVIFGRFVEGFFSPDLSRKSFGTFLKKFFESWSWTE